MNTQTKLPFWLPLIFLGLVFALHLPFLEADPDTSLSFSRGIMSDEGFYTMQMRNFADHGKLTYEEVDGIVKNPLFTAIQWPVFEVFGTHRITARMIVLLSVFFILALTGLQREWRLRIMLYAVLVMMIPAIFNFSHIAIAEVLCGALILAGIAALARFYHISVANGKINIPWLLITEVLFAAVFWMKNQFLYTAPLSVMGLLIAPLAFQKTSRRFWFRMFASLTGLKLIMLVLYFITWYLPNQDFYDMIMAESDHFNWDDTFNYFIQVFPANAGLGLYDWVLYLVIPAILTGVAMLWRERSLRKWVFMLAGCWLLLESHKLLLHYMPLRYYVSAVMAAGLIYVILVELGTEAVMRKRRGDWKLYLGLGIVLWFLTLNVPYWYHANKTRTFHMKNLNEYLDRHLDKEDVVLGVWAAQLTWKSNSLTYPLLDIYTKRKDLLEHYKPRLVITEPNQEEVNQLYEWAEIDLYGISDSTKAFYLREYPVILYWINQDIYKDERTE